MRRLIVVLIALAAAAACRPAAPTVTPQPTVLRTIARPTSCVAHGALPDGSCTPGVVNPDVTPARVQSTICVKGWTATIRPPLAITGPIKTERMAAYGLTGPASAYELDHLISLELGGHPTDVRNLWPEAYDPRPGAHEKDLTENYLRSLVCAGRMPLADAQRAIATDWTGVHAKLVAAGVQLEPKPPGEEDP